MSPEPSTHKSLVNKHTSRFPGVGDRKCDEINPGKSKAQSFMSSGEGFTKLFFGGPKNSGSGQLQIFWNNYGDLSWADQVNYTVQKV